MSSPLSEKDHQDICSPHTSHIYVVVCPGMCYKDMFYWQLQQLLLHQSLVVPRLCAEPCSHMTPPHTVIGVMLFQLKGCPL